MTDKRSAYQSRINRVLDHIDTHLHEPLQLPELARVAHFSPYHFHRIFRAMVGETVHGYVTRLRMERAAAILRNNPDRDVTGIAYDVGFSSPSTFARCFRGHFGMSATEWRKGECTDRKIGTMDRNDGMADGNGGTAQTTIRFYLEPHTNQPLWELKMTKKNGNELQSTVKLEDYPERHVAYVRHVGPYQGQAAVFEKLWSAIFGWAGMHGLMSRPDFEALCIYHDDPDITEPEKLRVSACVTAPEDIEVSGEIGRMTIPGGPYATADYELGPEDFADAWQLMFGTYLPESGFVPDERPCFELYGPPGTAPEGKHAVRICIPVKKM